MTWWTSIRTVKQRIRSHLLYLGIKEPAGLEHWSEKGVKALLKLPLQESAKDTMKSLTRELAFLKKERERVDKQIQSLCSEGERGSRELGGLYRRVQLHERQFPEDLPNLKRSACRA